MGTLLKEVWLNCGEEPRPCKFDKYMRRLNERGPEWAVENVETVVGWMRDEARNRGMAFDPIVATGLVRRLARRVLQEY